MRKYILKKTTKPCIYETYSIDKQKMFIAKFSYQGKQYPEKNFTKLFGCVTATQALLKLHEVKILISSGKNPFIKNQYSSEKRTLDIYFDKHIQRNEGKTKYSLTMYYKKHIQPSLGYKDVKNITPDDIQKILDTSLKDRADKTKKDLKLILNPIFRRAIKDRYIKDNPIEEIKFKRPKPKRELDFRIVSSLNFTVQEIYRQILQLEDEELKAIYLIGLMTGRRRGEILGLKYQDIRDNKVYVPESITKTSTVDIFPMPFEAQEIIPFLSSNYKGEDKIFSANEARVTRTFTKLVQDSAIEFTKDSKLTFHDTRHLFQSIMIPETNNPPLVDRCLSHKKDGSMMSVYLSFSYKKRKEVFEEYWEIIRGNKASK